MNAGTRLKGSHKMLSYKTAELLSRRPTKSQKKILLSQNEHENSSQTSSSSHTEEINRLSDPEEGEREGKKLATVCKERESERYRRGNVYFYYLISNFKH